MANRSMEEIWKDIPGYEGRYQISSYGHVRSVRLMAFGRDLIKKPEVHYTGYLYHKLWDLGHKSRRKIFVHRLVAITFLPNPGEKPIVNHMDRNRQNNCLVNLEWCDESENQQHWRKDDLLRKQQYEGVEEQHDTEPVPA